MFIFYFAEWTVYVVTPTTVSPSIWRAVGRSNSTVMSCPVITFVISVCFICSPLKIDGKTIRVFNFDAP